MELTWNICSEKCMGSNPQSYKERNHTLKRKHKIYAKKFVASDSELTNTSQLFNTGKFLIEGTKGISSRIIESENHLGWKISAHSLY